MVVLKQHIVLTLLLPAFYQPSSISEKLWSIMVSFNSESSTGHFPQSMDPLLASNLLQQSTLWLMLTLPVHQSPEYPVTSFSLCEDILNPQWRTESLQNGSAKHVCVPPRLDEPDFSEGLQGQQGYPAAFLNCSGEHNYSRSVSAAGRTTPDSSSVQGGMSGNRLDFWGKLLPIRYSVQEDRMKLSTVDTV